MSLAPVRAQECKRHKPEGCPGDNPEARLRCPFCLIMPALSILQKISNHLELIKGASLHALCSTGCVLRTPPLCIIM